MFYHGYIFSICLQMIKITRIGKSRCIESLMYDQLSGRFTPSHCKHPICADVVVQMDVDMI